MEEARATAHIRPIVLTRTRYRFCRKKGGVIVRSRGRRWGWVRDVADVGDVARAYHPPFSHDHLTDDRLRASRPAFTLPLSRRGRGRESDPPLSFPAANTFKCWSDLSAGRT